MPGESYVYVYFRLTGQPCYVGKGTGLRWRDHLRSSHNRRLGRILRKAGGDLPVAIVRDQLSHGEALELERLLISAIGRADQRAGPLVNCTDGGDGHSNPSEASRKLISDKAKSRQADPAVKAVLRERMLRQRRDPNSPLHAASKGRPMPEHAKRVIALKAAMRMKDPEVRKAAGAGSRGRKQSEATRNKRSASLLRHYEQRRTQGLSLARPARDELARRMAISKTMVELRRRQREERKQAIEIL